MTEKTKNRRPGKRAAAAWILLLILAMTAACLCGCERVSEEEDEFMGKEKYKVDYDGRKSAFRKAKNRYYEGEEVELYYSIIATDTDYAFYLDGEKLNPSYNEKYGYIIRFTMPDHDVKLTYTMKNTMEYIPPIEPGTMLIDYYDATVATVGGDGYTEYLVRYDTEYTSVLEVYRKQDPEEEETVERYIVSSMILDDFYDLCMEYDYASWADLDPEESVGMTGRYVSLRFRKDYFVDEYVHVTTESMPEDGMRALGAAEDLMRSYMETGTLLEE